MELECAVYGEGTAFFVKIARDAKGSALREAIFDKKRYKVRYSFAASDLTLYLAKKNGAWLKDDHRAKNFLQAGKSAKYEEEMLSSWKLDEAHLFGDDFEPGDKEIHILVELPSHVAISITDSVVEKAKKQIGHQVLMLSTLGHCGHCYHRFLWRKKSRRRKRIFKTLGLGFGLY